MEPQSASPAEEMADELDKLVYHKDMWLQAHGPSTGDYKSRRPAHEVETELHKHKVLLQAAQDYRAHADRQRQAQLDRPSDSSAR